MSQSNANFLITFTFLLRYYVITFLGNTLHNNDDTDDT